MDDGTFDRMTLRLGWLSSRRAAIGGLGLAALGIPGLAESKNRKRRKRKKRKKQQKVTFNDFGCVNVSGFCQTSEQCCSGICTGNQGQQTCRAHDQTTCQSGQDDYCLGGPPLPCDTSAGYSGACVHTTGNASYCQFTAYCHACSKDADCVPFCGPRSACIVADECCPSAGTACASVNSSGCTFQ